MNKMYSNIQDISIINSYSKDNKKYIDLYKDGFFSDNSKWENIKLNNKIEGLLDNIKPRLKYFMSQMSLGVYNALENGPGQNIKKEDEIYLVSGFTEIGTVSKIGDLIMENNYSINPSLFPNSVHHISLCYYTILKKISNYCTAITDGTFTNFSFINFIKNRVKLENDFVIVSGEEKANFFDYEENDPLEIVSTFTAYKITSNQKKGFLYKGECSSLEELKSKEEFKESSHVFTDIRVYNELKDEIDKIVLTEYPITKENPSGIALRLVLPFLFNISGSSILIEKIKNKYYYFEIKL